MAKNTITKNNARMAMIIRYILPLTEKRFNIGTPSNKFKFSVVLQ
jgi:hypothetical protein